MSNPYFMRKFRSNIPMSFKGPYVDTCPFVGASNPSCATCSEIDRCVPGSDRYDTPVKSTKADHYTKSAKSYPDCRRCSEAQRKKCSRRADDAIGATSAKILISLVVAVAVGIAGAYVFAVLFGFFSVAYALRLYLAMKQVQDGVRPVHALGCCDILKPRKWHS